MTNTPLRQTGSFSFPFPKRERGISAKIASVVGSTVASAVLALAGRRRNVRIMWQEKAESDPCHASDTLRIKRRGAHFLITPILPRTSPRTLACFASSACSSAAPTERRVCAAAWRRAWTRGLPHPACRAGVQSEAACHAACYVCSCSTYLKLSLPQAGLNNTIRCGPRPTPQQHDNVQARRWTDAFRSERSGWRRRRGASVLSSRVSRRAQGEATACGRCGRKGLGKLGVDDDDP